MTAEPAPFTPPDATAIRAALRANFRELADAIRRDDIRLAFSLLRSAKSAVKELARLNGRKAARVLSP